MFSTSSTNICTRAIALVALVCLAGCLRATPVNNSGNNGTNNGATNNGATNNGTDGGLCGNGRLDPGESCDNAIGDGEPGACDDDACWGATCSTAVLDAATCTCSTIEIDTCENGDGCCAAGCDSSDDDDCSATCGNGVVDDLETCDGNCPTLADCETGDACREGGLLGSPDNCTAECRVRQITTCVDGDGCCPAACDSGTDNDCQPSCGNGVLDQGEECDTAIPSPMPGACPESCADMDGNACTVGVANGDSCDKECVSMMVPNCTPCMDRSECGLTEDCEMGRCGTPAICSNARDPDAFCAVNIQTPFCSNGMCVQCRSSADCAFDQLCSMTGLCAPGRFDRCDLVREPLQFCQTFHPLLECKGQTCIADPFQCADCVACEASQTCIGTTCSGALNCATACEPDLYCIDQLGGPATCDMMGNQCLASN